MLNKSEIVFAKVIFFQASRSEMDLPFIYIFCPQLLRRVARKKNIRRSGNATQDSRAGTETLNIFL